MSKAATVYSASVIKPASLVKPKRKLRTKAEVAKPKRKRRTKAEIKKLEDAIEEYLTLDRPMSVRQVYYRLVANGLIPKTQNEYDSTVKRLVKMRRAGVIPYDWIADATRWMRKPLTHSSLSDALRYTLKTYRRAVWDEQEVHIEIWIEKEALAGVIVEETRQWDVPLYVSRGFSSQTYLWEAAQYLTAQGKPAHVYVLTDYDKAGRRIAGQIERGLREFAPSAHIKVERLAVLEEQITAWDLPTRPAKAGDGIAVDLDALPAWRLRAIVREAIEQHIDPVRWERLQREEEAEKESFGDFIRVFEQVN